MRRGEAGPPRGIHVHVHARCWDEAVHMAWLEATHTVLARGAGTVEAQAE